MNAPAYVDAIRSALEPTVEPGMRRIANLMVGAMAREDGSVET